MGRPAPALRHAYAAFRTVPTRWQDNDAYGHMNNAAYLSLVDTALSLWQLDAGIALSGPEAVRLVVVETACRYHAEIAFPDVVVAGLRVGHIGTSSVRFEVGLFRDAADSASAEAAVVQVLTGPDGRPTALAPDLRAAFEALRVAG